MTRRIRAFCLAAALSAAFLTGCMTRKVAEVAPTVTQAEPSRHNIDYPDGFWRGVDISTLIAMEQSGAAYTDFDGQTRDPLALLAANGVNAVRVRVWNDPYDAYGNGYGGGNCDVDKACEIGRRAAANGMKLLVDFHYSDFWADPSRQLAPKAWQAMSPEEKEAAVYEFTAGSLRDILRAGGDVGMVQIGNEINSGLAGETDDESVAALLRQASRAVRTVADESGRTIDVAVHYTGCDDRDTMLWRAEHLKSWQLDYDVFGVSYYPYWHGSLENLTSLLREIADRSGKRTMILETAYPFTLADGDGYPNVIGEEGRLPAEYPATPAGQAAFLTQLMEAAVSCGADGVCYWEGAWIPAGRDSWERYGSGWQTRFAGGYVDSAQTGGCAWENQALFDFSGRPLEALRMFCDET